MTGTARSQQTSPLAHGDSGKDWNKAHRKIRSDEALWNRLNWLGIHRGISGFIEMRECPCCGSQLGRPIKREKALDLLARIAGTLARTLDSLGPPSAVR